MFHDVALECVECCLELIKKTNLFNCFRINNVQIANAARHDNIMNSEKVKLEARASENMPVSEEYPATTQAGVYIVHLDAISPFLFSPF